MRCVKFVSCPIWLHSMLTLTSLKSEFAIIPSPSDRQMLGGGCRGCAPSPSEMTCSFLIQLVFCKKKKNCGLLVLKESKRRVQPLLEKILDPPMNPKLCIEVKGKKRKERKRKSLSCVFALREIRHIRVV